MEPTKPHLEVYRKHVLEQLAYGGHESDRSEVANVVSWFIGFQNGSNIDMKPVQGLVHVCHTSRRPTVEDMSRSLIDIR